MAPLNLAPPLAGAKLGKLDLARGKEGRVCVRVPEEENEKFSFLGWLSLPFPQSYSGGRVWERASERASEKEEENKIIIKDGGGKS